MNIRENIVPIMLAAGVAFIVALLVVPSGDGQSLGADVSTFRGTVTHTAVAPGPDAVTTVVSANTARQFLVLSNDGSEDVWIYYGATAADNTGHLIDGGATFVMQAPVIYTGQITAAAAASTSLKVVEK